MIDSHSSVVVAHDVEKIVSKRLENVRKIGLNRLLDTSTTTNLHRAVIEHDQNYNNSRERQASSCFYTVLFADGTLLGLAPR